MRLGQLVRQIKPVQERKTRRKGRLGSVDLVSNALGCGEPAGSREFCEGGFIHFFFRVFVFLGGWSVRVGKMLPGFPSSSRADTVSIETAFAELSPRWVALLGSRRRRERRSRQRRQRRQPICTNCDALLEPNRRVLPYPLARREPALVNPHVRWKEVELWSFF